MQQIHYAEVNGLRTRWADEGRGASVLMIHGAGLGYSLSVWSDVSRYLSNLGWRVIALDLPGYGATDSPPDYRTYSPQDFLIGFITQVCGDRVHLAGHSTNGNHVLNLALAAPNSLHSVIAIGTGRLLPGFSNPGGRGARAAVDEAAREPTLAEVRDSLAEDVYDPLVLTDERLHEVLAMSVGENFSRSLVRRRAERNTTRGGEAPIWERVRAATIPILAVYGEGDKNQAGTLAPRLMEECPNVRVELIPKCRHLVQWDAPETLATVLDDFCHG